MILTKSILKKIILESINQQNQKFITLYHGTTSSRAKQIREKGFDLKLAGTKSGHPMPGISTTSELKTAKDHARWAAKKLGDKPEVIKIRANHLNIAPGFLYFSKWDELGSSDAAIKDIAKSEEWDGVALFDPETGEGAEEYEVLIFDPDAIKIL